MLEPITALTPRPLRRPVLAQTWEDVTFLHWPVEPGPVAGLLPAGVRPDTLDGVTYVGLIAFRMGGTGLFTGPRLPYLGAFCETNVRLYSVDEAGRRGVVFLSMDAARLAPVLAARLSLRLPYMWSAMRLHRRGDVLTYTCRRRWPGPRGAGGRVTVRVGAPIAEPTGLERFLTARWGLHTAWYGRTLHLPNEHPSWRLHRAEVLELDERFVASAGLAAPAGAPVSVLYSPGVPAGFGPPARVGPR